MKTIFAKYNRERLPQFQIVTKILLDDDQNMLSVKQPLTESAITHIKNIKNNYLLLVNKYPHIKLVKPDLVNDRLYFEMIQHVSLEALLIDAYEKQNKDVFLGLIKKYTDYVDSFTSFLSLDFIPSAEFNSVFGEWTVSAQQSIIEVANVDLIFGNLFVDNCEIIQIDYEWVFNFPVPRSFIIWRSIWVFFLYHATDGNIIKLEDVLLSVGINYTESHAKFCIIDSNFQKYVYGETAKYLLNPRVSPPSIDVFEELRSKSQELHNKDHTILLKNQELEMIGSELSRKNDLLQMISSELSNEKEIVLSLKGNIDAILNSRSWKLTKVFRGILQLIKKIIK